MVCRFVGAQSSGNIAALIQLIDVQGLDFFNTLNIQLSQQLFGNLVISRGQHFTGIRRNHVFGQHFTNQRIGIHAVTLQAGFFDVADVFRRNPFTGSHQHIAGFIHQIQTCSFAFQARCNQISFHTIFRQIEIFFVVKGFQNPFVVVAQSFQQNGYRHFTAAVDTEIQQIFRIKLKIQPRTAVRNDACGEQQLA